MLYATQGSADPPTFTLFTNRELHHTYMRYLERSLREAFDLGQTPVKLAGPTEDVLRKVRSVAAASMAFGAAAAMVAAQRRRRQRHSTLSALRAATTLASGGDQPVSLGGRIGRQGEVAKVAGRMGVDYGLHQAKRTFASTRPARRRSTSSSSCAAPSRWPRRSAT